VARVALHDVTKRFGDSVALSGLSLDVHDHEFVVLLGPSGCGKSTVLRLIAGLEDPTGGTVTIDGRDVGRLEPKERDVAMVFQNYALYPHMSVRQNVEFPLACRRVPRRERRTLIAETTEALGVAGLLERRPAQLSGGQRQRVALARAIVCRPSAFLFDEPLSNLDAQLRSDTRALLAGLHRRLRTTVVYVTHDQTEAMTMADRIAVIDQGRVQQIGSPQAVYDRPATVFVAQFLGSPPMNCVPGRTGATVEGGRAVEVAGATLVVPGPLASDVGEDLAVTVGVRPEHVRLASDGPLPATVAGVELLGAERHVICRLDDGSTIVLREDSEGPAPSTGDRVRLDVDLAELHLFDGDTGERIGS
jgi:ABC-type sugar transport system ATPase subunit